MEHDFPELSFLYPNGQQACDHMIIDRKSAACLLKSFLFSNSIDVFEYLTDDIEIIKYRQEMFRDLLNVPKLQVLLKCILPMLETIRDLYVLKEKSYDTEGQIYSIKLIETYINFIKSVYDATSEFRDDIQSQAFSRLCEQFKILAESDEFVKLVNNTKALSKDISEVKSVTIGLNIDDTFSPYEFGILSMNNERITSIGFIDNLLGKKPENGLSAISQLKVTAKAFSAEEKRFADMAIASAISRCFKGVISDWEPAIKRFFSKKTKMYLSLIKELKFISFIIETLNELKDKDYPLCTPKIKEKSEKVFQVRGLYNPSIALSKKNITYNNITFDEKGMIYIITGPNSGGKSVFTAAIGICQIFFQLGLPVSGKSAAISPVEHIFISFADKSDSKDKGRLEEECVNINTIFSSLSEYSLVLMDETFSSTSSFEGAHIAFDVLAGLSAYGCRAVFSTHMHELLNMMEEINTGERAVSKIDTLMVGIEPDGQRNYRIIRAAADGKSYAKSISEKYSLDYNSIIQQLDSKNT